MEGGVSMFGGLLPVQLLKKSGSAHTEEQGQGLPVSEDDLTTRNLQQEVKL